jgi:hypothetical protein
VRTVFIGLQFLAIAIPVLLAIGWIAHPLVVRLDGTDWHEEESGAAWHLWRAIEGVMGVLTGLFMVLLGLAYLGMGAGILWLIGYGVEAIGGRS